MSYYCDICGELQPHGTPQTRIVVKTREREYPHRARANKDGSDDRGGRGTEIVREAVACAGCDK